MNENHDAHGQFASGSGGGKGDGGVKAQALSRLAQGRTQAALKKEDTAVRKGGYTHDKLDAAKAHMKAAEAHKAALDAHTDTHQHSDQGSPASIDHHSSMQKFHLEQAQRLRSQR